MDLQEARLQIDEVNRQMLDLLLKRNELSLVIGREKEKNKLAIEDPKREQEILRKMSEISPENKEEIETFFKCLFEISKEIQKKEVR